MGGKTGGRIIEKREREREQKTVSEKGDEERRADGSRAERLDQCGRMFIK